MSPERLRHLAALSWLSGLEKLGWNLNARPVFELDGEQAFPVAFAHAHDPCLAAGSEGCASCDYHLVSPRRPCLRMHGVSVNEKTLEWASVRECH
jgi:hypothetical protein